MPPPRLNDRGDLTYHINLMRELLRPGRERIFSPPDSDIPRLLQAIPEMAADSVTDDKYPAFAALAYGIAALYHYPTIEPEESRNKKKKYDPFSNSALENYDPLSENDRYMKMNIKWD